MRTSSSKQLCAEIKMFELEGLFMWGEMLFYASTASDFVSEYDPLKRAKPHLKVFLRKFLNFRTIEENF